MRVGLRLHDGGSATTWMTTAAARGSARRRRGSRTLPQPQPAARPGGQGPQGVGAALRFGARVVAADLISHLGQPPLQYGRVGRPQGTPQVRGARRGIGAERSPRRGFAAADPAASQRRRDRSDRRSASIACAALVTDSGPEPDGLLGQRLVVLGQPASSLISSVRDTIAAAKPRADHRPRRTAPRAGAADRAAPPPGTSGPRPWLWLILLRSGHLGGHRVPVVARPLGALGRAVRAAAHQLGDRGQPARRRGGLGLVTAADRGHQPAPSTARSSADVGRTHRHHFEE